MANTGPSLRPSLERDWKFERVGLFYDVRGNINFSTEIRRKVLEIPRNMEFFDVEEG